MDLILFDPSNPRSLAFQLQELDRDLGKLPRSDESAQSDVPRPAHRIVMKAMHYLETEILSADDEHSEEEELERLGVFVKELLTKMPGITEKLGWDFFTHVEFTTS
jgi:uncharacterized alpha-E superfamily protein